MNEAGLHSNQQTYYKMVKENYFARKGFTNEEIGRLFLHYTFKYIENEKAFAMIPRKTTVKRSQELVFIRTIAREHQEFKMKIGIYPELKKDYFLSDHKIQVNFLNPKITYDGLCGIIKQVIEQNDISSALETIGESIQDSLIFQSRRGKFKIAYKQARREYRQLEEVLTELTE